MCKRHSILTGQICQDRIFVRSLGSNKLKVVACLLIQVLHKGQCRDKHVLADQCHFTYI